MSATMIWIQVIGVLVAVACALPGTFLVLRRMALVSDAISHSILFGIVIGFMLLNVEVNNPLLIVTAAASGVLTVWLVEALTNTQRVAADAAIGLVFPVLFSAAVVLINLQFRNVHLDVDAVLLGEIAFAPLNRMRVMGVSVPVGVVVMSTMVALNIGFITLFYKELKLSTFDAGMAAALGFSPVVIHYGLMTLVSVTAVGAFDHVGAILVVALMIAPPATAYLLTDRLNVMLLLSAAIGAASAISGYWLARGLNVNIAGSMATMTGVFYLLALVFAPQRGLVAQQIEAYQRRRRFAVDLLLVHLSQHEGRAEEALENEVAHVRETFNWGAGFAESTLGRAAARGWVARQNGQLLLTEDGRERAAALKASGGRLLARV